MEVWRCRETVFYGIVALFLSLHILHFSTLFVEALSHSSP